MKIECTLTDRGLLRFQLCGKQWEIDPLDMLDQLVAIDHANEGKDRGVNQDWLRDTARLMVERGALPQPPTLYEAEIFYQLVASVYEGLKKKRREIVQTSVASLFGTTSTPAAGPASSAMRG